MKKILVLICMAFLLFISTSFAETGKIEAESGAPINKKVVIAIIPLIDHFQYKKVDTTLFTGIEEKTKSMFIAVPNSEMIWDNSNLDGLIKFTGISDVSLIEKSDLVAYGKANNINYIVVREMMPVTIVHSRGWLESNTATVTLKIKIVDVNNGKYLYFNTITEKDKSSNTGGMFGAPSTIAPVKKALSLIVERFNPEISPVIQQIISQNNN